MLTQYLLDHIATVVELLVLICVGLVGFGKLKASYDAKQLQMERDMATINTNHSSLLAEFGGHLKENHPHRSCAVEEARLEDVMGVVDEVKRSISRIEGWVMALAAKQGIREPRNGD